MSFIEIYILFSLTTAIVACYELVYPVIKFRKTKKTKVDNEALIYITMFVICLVIPFLIFFSCVIPSRGVKFKEGLYDGLFGK